MSTRPTAVSAPRSYRIHCPSPYADQRVARLLSSVFWGMLPSFPLATTETTESGVRLAEGRTCVRGMRSGWGSVRSRSHASASRTGAASDALSRASRLDSLNLKGMIGRSLGLMREGPHAFDRVVTAYGPEGLSCGQCLNATHRPRCRRRPLGGVRCR